MSSRRRRLSVDEDASPSTDRVEDRRRFSRDNQYTAHHVGVFVITFMSFALIHAARKTLSTVKGSMIGVWTHNSTHGAPLFPSNQAAEDFLALLDFGFLFAYAVGLYVGGVLGDRYSPRVILSIGVWLAASVVFLFGYVTEVFEYYHTAVYFTLWVSGGLFQSVAWPTEICIMGNWFGRGSRGLSMGVWSGCASVGNIIGTLVTSAVIHMGYEYAFAVNSTILFLFGFVIFFGLKAHPREIGLSEPLEWESDQNDVIEESGGAERPIGFWRAWKLPGVIPYSFAYACLKMVTYGFFFWLPFYLHSNFGWPEKDADALSTFFDVGGITAAVVGGVLSDRLSSRTPVVVIMLVIASFCLGVYSIVPGEFFVNAIMLTIVGFFVAGPANMISSSVSADLGKARELRGNTAALSTVTGIVDGTGSVGAAIGMLLIPWTQRTIGWSAVFYGFIVMVICTTLCLLPLLYREWREYRRARLGIDPDEMSEGEGERQGLLANEE